MVSKSKKKITDSLLALMEVSRFSEITVAEICAWSKVSRGTFYNNFESKDDVLSQLSRDMIFTYMEQFVSGDSNFVEEMVYYFFRLSKEQKSYLALLSKERIFHLHSTEIYTMVSHHEKVISQPIFLRLPQHVRKYTLRAYVSCGLAVYEEWVSNGFRETTEEITEIFLNIMHYPDKVEKLQGTSKDL